MKLSDDVIIYLAAVLLNLILKKIEYEVKNSDPLQIVLGLSLGTGDIV